MMQNRQGGEDMGHQSVPSLLGMDRLALQEMLQAAQQPAYRARQILAWVHRRGVLDAEVMTDLSRPLRTLLASYLAWPLPQVLKQEVSACGTRKYLLGLEGGGAVECVFIPEVSRGTLCISSQLGCPVACPFCATGTQGVRRQLSAHEIMAQLILARGALGAEAISNVVFMGMGEPLLNLKAVLPVVRLLTDEAAYGLSKRRVTISTSGVVPAMDRLASETDVALAVSLHAPDDALRDVLVPMNRHYPLEMLLAACRRYLAGKDHKSHITFEYCLLAGVNDSPAQARALARLLSGMRAKINIIPFNPFPGTPFARPTDEAIDAFGAILHARGLRVTTRRSRGDEIAAACGQLVGNVPARLRRDRNVPAASAV
jgi:23S rRNA (adenine2503-C2)-methyltransferase